MSETQPADPNLMSAVQTSTELLQQWIMTRAALITAHQQIQAMQTELDALKAGAKEPDAANARNAAVAVGTVLNGRRPHTTHDA